MKLVFKWKDDIGNIPCADWNRLASPLPTPFLEWEWLAGLERAGCVGGDSGWLPHHLTVWRGKRMVAAAPLYLKLHSRGEFVFDQEWAEVSHHLGIPYYPKLLGMSPFSPVYGYRFLIDPDEDETAVCSSMLEEIDRFCDKRHIAGCHFLHTDRDWRGRMTGLGMGAWLHHALVWENPGFATFDDYLAMFKSRRRNKIKRERKAVCDAGLTFRTVSGDRAPPELFRQGYAFYAMTCRKFFGWSHYLNLSFFQGLAENFAKRVLFVLAEDSAHTQAPVAMAFLVTKDDWLYGRYWGCREHYDHLHFETCYYRPIEWAIRHRIRFFDAGSGNARHKQWRGFPATPSYSLHRLYSPVMDEIWRHNIDRVNMLEQRHIDLINKTTPCANTGS